jgi:hypothetical protein
MDQAQPDPLANCEGDLPMFAIIALLVPLLRLFKPFVHLDHEFIPLLQLRLDRRNAHLTWGE